VRIEVFWRVAVVQLLSVAMLFVLLAVTVSHGFFRDWGWLVGPLIWLGCAGVTARIVGLMVPPTLLRAVGAGLVSALFVLIGLHELGLIIAIGLFAYLCAQHGGRGVAWN
jgi:hypothetical protein